MMDLLKGIQSSLAALGVRRLAALGLAGLTVFVLVAVAGYVLSRPQHETLYAGLDPEDVTRIGAVLADAGFAFDVSAAGDTVSVPMGMAARARMMLAQKGLPRSDTAGYELFDKLGSLGLTTFMQQVTRVRALEGELARTIQQIDGVRAARVHLAMRSDSSFRSRAEQPTASVVIRAERATAETAANAIRHLVAAAIPGLAPAHVTVMNADGTLLASSDDSISALPERLIGLERELAADIEQRVSRTIAPYLGLGNFTVSVSAKLNTDRRQISETAFDPNSRVERSVRTIKESGEAENAAGSEAVTVEQNIPVEETPKSGPDSSRERKDRKEELTNYEINSKSVSTTSEGYGIDRLSVAIVVNRAQIARMLGDNTSAEAIEAKVREIERLAVSAAGISEARGDSIAVSAIDFLPEDAAPAESAEQGLLEGLAGHLGSLINATALIAVSLVVVMLGLRPALRVIIGTEVRPEPGNGSGLLPGQSPLPGPADRNSGSLPRPDASGDQQPIPVMGNTDPLIDQLTRGLANDPKERLAKIVEIDPDRAVEVLKQWLSEPSRRAA